MKTIDIDSEQSELKLVLDTRFYGDGAIMQAAKDYLESCWVYVNGDSKNSYIVHLKPKSKDIDLNTLGYEFYNYVLGLMQNAIF